jgi:putative Mg2+ transporter-C (MgtC) family protein
MTPVVVWHEIVLRLLTAIVAGVVLGINRTERNRPAGLRTVILVTMAASAAMILANLLLITAGKASDSFAVIDPMRLPLGILTGMGFIGGGAILRKGELVQGVTTAATLWLATIIGLCFGGGQYLLGGAALASGSLVLWGLKSFEVRLPHDRHATVLVQTSATGPTEDAIRSLLIDAGFWIVKWDVQHAIRKRSCTIRADVGWRGRSTDTQTPPLIEHLAGERGVMKLIWKN